MFFSFKKTDNLILKFIWKRKAIYMETSQGYFGENLEFFTDCYKAVLVKPLVY